MSGFPTPEDSLLQARQRAEAAEKRTVFLEDEIKRCNDIMVADGRQIGTLKAEVEAWGIYVNDLHSTTLRILEQAGDEFPAGKAQDELNELSIALDATFAGPKPGAVHWTMARLRAGLEAILADAQPGQAKAITDLLNGVIDNSIFQKL